MRRVCQNCKSELTLPEKLDAEVRAELKKLPADVTPAGLDISKPLVFYRGRGCARCENTGYKGRIAIVEVFPINAQIQKLIVSGGDLISNIRDEAMRQGMYSMKQDGILKGLRGLTTIEEVISVTRD